MDEWANVALPDEFGKILATCRSREISICIIIQAMAQMKALFKDDWESLVGNCDTLLYLGGNEPGTFEYISKLLDKETLDTNTYGRTRGRQGSFSTNDQQSGRELMTPGEVRMLDNQYALLFIRGERPVMDRNTSQTPYTLFKWAYDNGYYSGDGLSHSCLTKLLSLYGLKGTWIANDAKKITEALKAGHPVIAHMGPGIFTDQGHYIVLRGITDDGHVLVNDPGNRKRNLYAYLLSTVVAQARTSSCFMVCSN